MRTSLTLDAAALRLAKAKATRERKSLSKAVSELILQAVQKEVVFRSTGGIYGSRDVEAALAND
jgi:hypothetical protein